MESYVVRQEKSGIKVGDIVRVVARPVAGKYLGWENSWVTEMNNMVGKLCKVTYINGDVGIRLDDTGYFPYYVLEVVKEAKVKVKVQLKLNPKNKYIARNRSGGWFCFNKKPGYPKENKNTWDGDEIATADRVLDLSIFNHLAWKDTLFEINENFELTKVEKPQSIVINGKNVEMSSESMESLHKFFTEEYKK